MDTSRDTAEREARQRELERYRTLVEAAGDVMYALDERGCITLVNEDPVAALGYSKESLLGTHVSEVLPAEAVERGTELIRELLADPERRRGRFEFRATRPDGAERIYEDNLAVLTGEDGSYAGSVGVIRDITQQRRQQAELRRQNERLEEFASVVSHDLRNPLQVARGYLERAERTGDEAAFERARAAHDRMETIIEDVLTLARQGETVRETASTDLDEIARDAWKTVDTEGMELRTIGDTRIEGEPDRLRTLFENLFRNSAEHGATSDRREAGDGRDAIAGRDATAGRDAIAGRDATAGRDGDATVTVRVGPIETMPTSTRVAAESAGGFYVADDGPGIPEEHRSSVFDSGFSTAPDGTGFGLAIVEQIAEAHGWEVTITESRDGGARFEFTGTRSGAPL